MFRRLLFTLKQRNIIIPKQQTNKPLRMLIRQFITIEILSQKIHQKQFQQ